QLPYYKVGLSAVIRCATVSGIVAVPAGFGGLGIEGREVQLRNMAGGAVHADPSAETPHPPRRRLPILRQRIIDAISAPDDRLPREARRRTKSRSVTSCAGPEVYSRTWSSTTNRRILTSRASPESARVWTACHFPSNTVCSRGAAEALMSNSKAIEGR